MSVIVVLEVLKDGTIHVLSLVTDKVYLALVSKSVCDSITIIKIQVNTCVKKLNKNNYIPSKFIVPSPKGFSSNVATSSFPNETQPLVVSSYCGDRVTVQCMVLALYSQYV